MSHIIKANGAPTVDTSACIGDIYLDLETYTFYELKDVNYISEAKDRQFVTTYEHEGPVEFIWEQVGGSDDMGVFTAILQLDNPNTMDLSQCTADQLHFKNTTGYELAKKLEAGECVNVLLYNPSVSGGYFAMYLMGTRVQYMRRPVAIAMIFKTSSTSADYDAVTWTLDNDKFSIGKANM